MHIKKTVLFLTLMTFATSANGQVLMSLIFGDKLNSDKIEFGLEGGLVNSGITNLDGAQRTNGFNIGFYFDFKMNEKLFIHTGVIVKSPLGVEGLANYSTGDLNLDMSLDNSKVSRNLRYFNVPILAKFKISDHFYGESGTQLGLLFKAFDEFISTSESGGDISYRVSIKDEMRTIDIGVALGFGYRILKNNGMNIGMRYYHGFIDINKNNNSKTQANSGFYLYAGLPIGVKKAKLTRETKKQNEETLNK